MGVKIAEIGRQDTAADCFIHLEIREKGGLDIDLKSKVASMYSSSIKTLVQEMMSFFSIDNAYIHIEDSGTLPFVLSARIEGVIKKLFLEQSGNPDLAGPDKKPEFISPIINQNLFPVARDKIRRSRLYVPGDQSRFIINAGLYSPDAIILDLEDAVAPAEKYGTRFIVRNTLREVDFFGAERMVRINQLPMGLEDLEFIVGHGVHTILIPKCETADQVKEIEARIQELRTERKIGQEIYLMPIIESALGIVNAYQIAMASPNNIALTIGLEDYTADIGAERTKEGKESLLARQSIVTAARAAKVQPIDSVFSDIGDIEGLKRNVLESKSLGFEGMGCIHPNQIRVIHENFAPTQKEIDKAKRIVLALEEAQKKGLGVVALGTKMIDPPVVKRAEKILKLAIQSGIISDIL
ncbi:MAG: HpcH/HpaI aldolase/citrate lyase family protein [Candidatus Stahlbacteria bacterium]|nr:HpcH/HpaI aldolase/citrate lyase family protein [Candidatus Stahlbacteria bacterium]